MAFLIRPQVNETVSPPDDKCVKYTCQDVNGDPMVKESKKICPDFNPEICVPVSFGFHSFFLRTSWIYIMKSNFSKRASKAACGPGAVALRTI